MLGYRNGDAVLTICQNNQAKSIEIIDLNEPACALTGYAGSDVQGRLLAATVPPRLATLLLEYVEYEPDANDVGVVLSRVQNFSLMTKEGKEKSFRLKVVRGESTKDRMMFRLVLQDMVDLRRGDALQQLIRENFKGHEIFHPTLRIPDRHSLEKDLELTTYYHHKAGIRASLVVMRVDHLPSLERQYGAEQRDEILKHLVRVCRGNLRPDDVVAAASDVHIAVLLFDAVSDATRLVANRLRWQIAAQPYTLPDHSMLNLTASMVYSNLTGNSSPETLLTTCLELLLQMDDAKASQLLESSAE